MTKTQKRKRDALRRLIAAQHAVLVCEMPEYPQFMPPLRMQLTNQRDDEIRFEIPYYVRPRLATEWHDEYKKIYSKACRKWESGFKAFLRERDADIKKLGGLITRLARMKIPIKERNLPTAQWDKLLRKEFVQPYKMLPKYYNDY
jgi:hypothetical protein